MTCNKAAVYCRVALADNIALEAQRQSVRAFAALRGFAECAEYLDNGGTGLTLDRPALNLLCEDMRAGKIQTLFTKDIARIGRGFVDTSLWLQTAREFCVDIIFQSSGMEDGEALAAILREAMHDWQRRQLKSTK